MEQCPRIAWSAASDPPRSSHWHANVCRAICDVLRTWFEEKDEYFELPRLDDAPDEGIQPFDLDSRKVGQDTPDTALVLDAPVA